MRRLRREQVRRHLGNVLDEKGAETVLQWIISNESRRPVVVVGAGFTRNARNKRSGALAGDAVPLWPHVLRRMAADLNVQPGDYDAPTLAELYAESVSESGLHNMLLSLLDDELIEPGVAHQALFNYSAEAIITTNQLDTLLDQNDKGWLRVVRDGDLALYKRNAPNVQLIYFHGHRSDCASWVFTRSEYESIERTRPLVVTRVRQLLTQFPVLIVGYSLSDPDFHHLYRQLSLDMRNRHPQGLAVFVKEPHAAERRHWEKLGIRIVSLKQGPPPDQLFAKFFEIDPNAADLDADAAVEFLLGQPLFSERWSDARETLTDFDAASLDPDERARIWRACLPDAPAERPLRDENDDGTDVLRVLPKDRFRHPDSITRAIDEIVATDPTSATSIIDWLAFGLGYGPWRSRGELGVDQLLNWHPLHVVLSTVIRFATERASPPVPSKDHGAIMEDCLARMEQGTGRGDAAHVRDDAAAIGIASRDAVVPPDEDPLPLGDGVAALLNGEFELACKSYEEQGKVASDGLTAWTAVRGELRALQGAKAGEAAIRAIRRRVRLLDDAPRVKAFRDEAEKRRFEAVSLARQSLADELDTWRRGGETTRINVAPFALFRSFRELERRGADPGLQLKLLQPLLDLDALQPATQLKYRLRFRLDGTGAWLKRHVEERKHSIDEQRRLDRALFDAVRAADETRTMIAARLQLFPALGELADVDDIEWGFTCLARTRDLLDSTVETSLGSSVVRHEYPGAIRAWSAIAPPKVAIMTLEEYASQVEHSLELKGLLKQFSEFPWEQWVAAEPTAHASCVDIAASLSGRVRDLDAHEVAPPLWAIAESLRASGRYGRNRLTPSANGSVVALVERLVGAKDRIGEGLSSGLAAAVRVGGADRLVAEIVERGLRIDDPTERVSELDAQVGFAAVALELRAVRSDDPRVTRLRGATLGRSADIRRFLDLNPHYVGRFGHLCEQLIAVEGAACNDAHELVLDVAREAPGILATLAGVLSADRWGRRWTRLQACIREAVTVERGGFGVIGKTSVLRAWMQALTASEDDDGLEPSPARDLDYLFDAAVAMLSDDRNAVANVAAYAIVAYARTRRDSERNNEVCDALGRIAEDSRVSVRHAGSFAAGYLAHRSGAEQIQSVARSIEARFADDPSAIIRRQLEFGRALANRPRPADRAAQAPVAASTPANDAGADSPRT
jgi:hypothetical protein